jgi:hypothetical protein
VDQDIPHRARNGERTSCYNSGTDACAWCVHRPGGAWGLTWAGRVGESATTETTTGMSAEV